MAALDGAIAKVEALMGSLEAGLSDRSAAPRLRVDPDDPWADTINPPEGVYKVRAARRAAQRMRARSLDARARGAAR
jgi:hypothetical protein